MRGWRRCVVGLSTLIQVTCMGLRLQSESLYIAGRHKHINHTQSYTNIHLVDPTCKEELIYVYVPRVLNLFLSVVLALRTGSGGHNHLPTVCSSRQAACLNVCGQTDHSRIAQLSERPQTGRFRWTTIASLSPPVIFDNLLIFPLLTSLTSCSIQLS